MLGHTAKILTKRCQRFFLEIERKDRVDRIAALFQSRIGNVGVCIPVAGKSPREGAQAADAKTNIVLTEECDSRLCRSPRSIDQAGQSAAVQFLADDILDRQRVGQVE